MHLYPLENNSVASVKHCSILALGVLCSPQSDGEGKCASRGLMRKGAEERDVCHG